MSVAWLTPIAFAGLALLAAPILIHLLTRRERRPIPFPSLRFLRPTRLSALSRRRIDDWPLLLLRLTVIAAAVGALAGPLLVTPARERAWASRISRALVVSDDVGGHDEERRTAMVTETFQAGQRMADAIDAALAWLALQPPSAREIVIAADLRAGMLTDADIARVPPSVGVRFVPFAGDDVRREVAVPILANGEAGPVSGTVAVELDDEATLVSTRSLTSAGDAGDGALQVLAAPGDRAIADAALRAVLSSFVVRDQAARRRVAIAFAGADVTPLGPAVTPPSLDWISAAVERLGQPARQHGDTLVVSLDTRPTDAQAAVEIARVAATVFDDGRAALEPRRLTAAELTRWSRPPGPPDANQPRQDEGDRRWLWGLALALLLVEQWVRRGRGRTPSASTHVEEAHVA